MFEHLKRLIHNMKLTPRVTDSNECSHTMRERPSSVPSPVVYTYFFIIVSNGEEWNIIIAYRFIDSVTTEVKHMIGFVKQCGHTDRLRHSFAPLPRLIHCWNFLPCACFSLGPNRWLAIWFYTSLYFRITYIVS